MNNLLVKQILGATVLAIAVAVFSGIFGDFLYQTKELDKPVYIVKKSDDDNGGEPSPDPAPEVSVLDLLATADLEQGAKTFKKKCTACHTAEAGGKHKSGPALYNVVGRDKAIAEGYKGYSSAMQEFGGNWSYEELNEFLTKPKSYIAGTKMGFGGFKKVEDRVNVIAYLRTMSDNPIPLP